MEPFMTKLNRWKKDLFRPFQTVDKLDEIEFVYFYGLYN